MNVLAEGMDVTQLSDRQLLNAHVAGDPDAFNQLFQRHRDRLWAVALRTLKDPEEAADALQEAMISAFRRADTFRGDAQVTTWLHRIVVNACLDRIRRNRVRRRLRHLALAHLARDAGLPGETLVVVRALPPAATAGAELGDDLDAAWSAALTRLARR